MAIISSTTIIRMIASTHLIAAYYFLTSPWTVATHNLVVVISAAIGLPLPLDDPSAAVKQPSSISALLAAVLALSALSDLAATSMREEFTLIYFSAQTPVRLLCFFGLTAWSYSYRPGGLLAGRRESEAMAAAAGRVLDVPPEGAFANGIGSGLVFSWGFLSVVFWFWVFVTLRDERREAAGRVQKKEG